MDIRIVILGIAAVAIIFMMGNDPLEEIREEAKKYTLESQIKDHFEKERMMEEGTDGYQSMFSTSQQGDGAPGLTSYGFQQAPTTLSSPGNFAPTSNEVLQLQGTTDPTVHPLNRGETGPMGARPDWAAMQEIQRQQGGNPNAQPQTQPEQQTNSGYFLTDGKQIYFAGYRVFFKAPNGNLKPLPNGNYEMRDGEQFSVKNGRRQSR